VAARFTMCVSTYGHCSSDLEGEGRKLHNNAVVAKTILSTSGEVTGDDEDRIDEEGVPSDTANSAASQSVCSSLPGAPDKWKPPQPPETWISYTVNDKKFDAPNEDKIDNPGSWHLFLFRPKYNDKKKYMGHFTPAGAKVLASNDAGKLCIDGLQFFYNGWVHDDFDKSTYVRGGATRETLKPVSRHGCLDVDVLKKHGLTAERVRNDPLWFFQMIFPLCQTKNSTISGDNRIPFFTQVTWYTHIYAAEKGASLGFGHSWVPPDVVEMVRWTAISICNGSLDGQPGTLSS